MHTPTIPNKKRNFVYMDDVSIDVEFKCPICFEPFDNPVSTPCDHTFCRKCIENSIKCNQNPTCPSCRHGSLSKNNLVPANRIISNRIDRYTVKCLTCGEKNILRGHFEEHVNNICSKANVSCPAAKVRCPWTGPRDQLEGHTNLCLYEQMRPVLSELVTSNESQQKQLNTQSLELKSIQDKLTVQLKKMQEQSEQLKKMQEQSEQLKKMQEQSEQLKKIQQQSEQRGKIQEQQALRLRTIENKLVKAFTRINELEKGERFSK